MNISGIIIAGGKSRRMGFDKTQIKHRQQTFLMHAIKLLENFTDDIIISTNRPIQTPYKQIPDTIKDIGPMGGLYTCLSQIKTSTALVIPADMPLLNTKVIAYLLKQSNPKLLLNLLEIDQQPQMLTGLYHKNIIPYLTKLIEQKNYRLRSLLRQMPAKLIPADSFRDNLLNVNTPNELKKIISKYEE